MAALIAAPLMSAQEALLTNYKAAVQAHQAQDFDVALTRYRECLAVQPIPAIHNNVAAILLSRGEKRAAEDEWRQAVKIKPDYAEAHYNLAVLLSEDSGREGHLEAASEHCELALKHKEGYVQAHHLMGNIRMSQGLQDDAASWYARAEALAGGGAAAGASGGGSTEEAKEFRWEGVEVGHTRRLQLPNGSSWTMQTLSMRPLAFLVRDFLSADECDRLIELARPRLQASLLMGNASASERTSESVFLGAASDGLLRELQQRLAALVQLPAARVSASEDLQVVHYVEGATFGMHHDSSKFLPRLLTAFYYLNEPDGGGETAFPAADGAMTPAEAMGLKEPAAEGAGLVVKPTRGAALLWYNHDEHGEVDPFAVHAGCRVTAGEKWGANHWVRAAGSGGGGGGASQQTASPAEEEAGARGEAEAGKNAAKNKKRREKEKAKKAAAAAEKANAAEPEDIS